jgi:VWFA-related protein
MMGHGANFETRNPPLGSLVSANAASPQSQTTQTQVFLFLLALLVALVLSSIPLYSESEYTIRASTTEVRLAFAASDRQGHVVRTLQASDIAVADNGWIIRHFRSFRPASESPLDLVILLDASASVEAQIPAEIAAVKNFVESSAWGARDQVSILAFGGSRPQLICAHNCTEAAARVQLNSLRANGSTPLYDALFGAAEVLKENREPELRPAIILFSDGVDTISIHSASDAVAAAQNLQAAIYCVNSRSGKSAPDRGDAVLNALAASTGGLSYASGQDVSTALRAVLDDLHSSYVLTYDLPEQLSGQHSVRVLPTSDPQLQFRSRTAYDDRLGR